MKNFLAVAQESCFKAGKEALNYFNKEHTFHHKGELANFATEADLASEKVIFEMVQKNFPKHNFLSEEMGLVDNKNEYTWVVDPIDGTVNFSHGQVLWGVSMALFKKDKPIMGVIYMPVLKELFWAEKGKGAWVRREMGEMGEIGEGEKIGVSGEKVLEKSLMGAELDYPATRPKQKFPMEKFFRYFPTPITNYLSTVYELTSLASGRMDGFIEESPYIWDIGAGVLMVEEAGGKVTDWEGKPIIWDLGGKKHYNIIVSNGILHKEILIKFKSLKV